MTPERFSRACYGLSIFAVALQVFAYALTILPLKGGATLP